MTILERQIQVVRPDKRLELEEIDKRWSALERRYGCPLKSRYSYIAGRCEAGTIVIERRWESLAAYEAAFSRINADPEAKALGQATFEVIESSDLEFLWVEEEDY